MSEATVLMLTLIGTSILVSIFIFWRCWLFLIDTNGTTSVRKRAPSRKVSRPVSKPKRVAKTPAPAPAPVVKTPAPTPTPAPAPVSGDRLNQIKQLQHQMASLNSMIKNLDTQFQAGSVSQTEYLEKKNFLAVKLGGLQGQLQRLRG